uniref:Uncharacterized protein n=1 Tax=Romanomermis culicivorax TaxID=13658 RepID=A0A915JPY5_ROMCU
MTKINTFDNRKNGTKSYSQETDHENNWDNLRKLRSANQHRHFQFKIMDYSNGKLDDAYIKRLVTLYFWRDLEDSIKLY